MVGLFSFHSLLGYRGFYYSLPGRLMCAMRHQAVDKRNQPLSTTHLHYQNFTTFRANPTWLSAHTHSPPCSRNSFPIMHQQCNNSRFPHTICSHTHHIPVYSSRSLSNHSIFIFILQHDFGYSWPFVFPEHLCHLFQF